jgi:hypothetical protein
MKLYVTGILLLLAGCAHDPNKAGRDDGQVAGETVGVTVKGDMVVQRKVLASEEVRRIQIEVYELEDHVYGNEHYGSKGLYGVYKDCRIDQSAPANGGDGHLAWTEPLERVSDKEADLKLGIDESGKLVGVTEEMLLGRIERFRGYKQVLLKREEEYQDKIAICHAALKAAKPIEQVAGQ